MFEEKIEQKRNDQINLLTTITFKLILQGDNHESEIDVKQKQVESDEDVSLSHQKEDNGNTDFGFVYMKNRWFTVHTCKL